MNKNCLLVDSYLDTFDSSSNVSKFLPQIYSVFWFGILS